MYTLAVQRRFEATHHLIGGDWGAENDPHSHPYRMELQLHGDKLDQHGYLVDIVDVEKNLDELLSRYANADLNALSEFAGLNPSLEHFARILCEQLASRLRAVTLNTLTVQLWESDIAWASFRTSL